MSLLIPKYLSEACIQNNKLTYTWDDWKLEEIYNPIDEDLYERLEAISHRANMGFTIACGEWIVHRFNTVSDDPVPLQHLEAAWASMLNSRYARYWEPPDEEWMGPIRGPLSLAIIFSIEVFQQADEEQHPALSSGRIAKLAEHILTDPNPFLDWRERIVKRLEEFYPLDEKDSFGDVVPREAFNPDFRFTPSMTEVLIQRFLSGITYSSNHFLQTPEKMKEEGFEGTPYSFDIEKDRVERLDW